MAGPSAANNTDPPVPSQPNTPSATPQTPANQTPPAKTPFTRQAAQFSWLAPLVVFGVHVVVLQQGSDSRTVSLVVTVLTAVLLPTALVLSIVALVGIRRHGREGILIPAISGLIINLICLAAVVWGMLVFLA